MRVKNFTLNLTLASPSKKSGFFKTDWFACFGGKSDEIEPTIENPVIKNDLSDDSKAKAAEKIEELVPEKTNQDSQEVKKPTKVSRK